MRKHIRIEQQLKLHIETIEYKLDELENENEKIVKELEKTIIEKDISEARAQ